LGLAVDALIGLLSRASPQVGFKEVGAPVRILAGGALLWLAIGVISERLLAFAVGTGDAMRTVLEAGT
jgi:flagellar biosynthetic protein FliR/type III secretion protein T